MKNPRCISSPPSYGEGEVLPPEYAQAREVGRIGRTQSMPSIITRIENYVPLRGLTGRTYCGPLLRFMYTIGPKNARLLKYLKFEGKIKLRSLRYWLS
jgi:hypothetical protein